MRSVRLDAELDEWLQEEARSTGRSVSDLVREAVRLLRDRRRDDALGSTLQRVTGAIDLGSIDSRNTGRAYTESLKRKYDARRRGRSR